MSKWIENRYSETIANFEDSEEYENMTDEERKQRYNELEAEYENALEMEAEMRAERYI